MPPRPHSEPRRQSGSTASRVPWLADGVARRPVGHDTDHVAARGFTLVEALVVVAIVGILAGVASPSFGAWIDRTRTDAAATRMASTLSSARLDAIKFAAPVVVCASDDGDACGEEWSAGWLAFRDDDRDGTRAVAEPVLLREANEAGGPGIELVSSANARMASLGFDYRGYPTAAAAATFERGAARARVDVNLVGRVKLR